MPDLLDPAPAPAAKQLIVPPLDAPDLLLKAVTPDDQMFLQLVATSTDLAARWRLRGATPGPQEWAQATWGGTLAQFIVIARDGERPVGLVAVQSPSFQDGHAKLDAAKFDAEDRSPIMRRGFALFVDYVFACWDFHKLYAEVAEHAYPRVARWEGGLFDVEARLRDHTWLAGRRWDHLVLALYRDRWMVGGRDLLLGAPAT